MGQTISEPNASELQWIADNVVASREVIVAIGGSLADGEAVTPSALDAAWTAWLAQWRAGKEDPNPAVNMFGLAFGPYLINHLGVSWKVVQDQYGTEIAVHGQPGDVLVFPTNLVPRRLESRTINFFVPVAAGVEEQVTKGLTAPPAGGGFGRFFRRTGDQS